MTRRLFAWIIAASLGLAPAAVHRLLPVAPDTDRRVAPQPVRDPEPPHESPIEYVAGAAAPAQPLVGRPAAAHRLAVRHAPAERADA